jgi:glycosyltransferase involved in cell wall biosynthesis
VRIVQLCDLYDPFVGGLERHVQTLSRELVRRGHDVTVVTLWRAGSPPEERDEHGVRIIRIGGWSKALLRFFEDPEHHFHPPSPDPGTSTDLARLMRRLTPDVVHSHSWILYSYLALPRRLRAPTIHTAHDYGVVCAKQNYLHDGSPCTGPGLRKCLHCAPKQYGAARGAAITTGLMASGQLHRRVDRFVAISSAVADASQQGTHKPPSSMEVVPTFTPDGIVDEGLHVPRPSFLPDHDDYLLFVGALTAHKGLDVLLDAHARMSTQVPLVLLGTPRSDTPDAGPAGVTIRRNVPHPQVMAAWTHAAIGVVPSVWPEPMGQVAVEAMAVGKPVVASDIGGLGDVVVHGETGILVPPGDPGALAQALDGLLADPVARLRMGAAGAQRSKLFMVSAVVDRLEKLYRELHLNA